MTILFLDFDGVLHSEGCKQSDFFSKLPLLERWLTQHQGVDVVISSSWRRTRSLAELKSYFSQSIRGRIVGATPNDLSDEDCDGRFTRESEIMAWLRKSEQPWRSWVALDDKSWLFKPFNNRLVLCDAEIGLTEAELVRLSLLVATVT